MGIHSPWWPWIVFRWCLGRRERTPAVKVANFTPDGAYTEITSWFVSGTPCDGTWNANLMGIWSFTRQALSSETVFVTDQFDTGCTPRGLFHKAVNLRPFMNSFTVCGEEPLPGWTKVA